MPECANAVCRQRDRKRAAAVLRAPRRHAGTGQAAVLRALRRRAGTGQAAGRPNGTTSRQRGSGRGSEILSLIQALNTGHDGSLSTVHANSASDALRRLETLVMQSAPSWPLAAIRNHLGRCLDVVVHVERADGGRRRVAEVGEVVVTDDGEPTVRRLTVGDDVTGDLERTRRWGQP